MGALKLEEFGDRMVGLLPKLKIEMGCYENNTLAKSGLTETQLLVLECLSTCGPCKMHILVEALKSKFSAVTAMIDRLVKIDFVTREHGKEDRRTVLVGLSAKGRKVLKEVREERRKVFMQVFSRVSQVEREEYLRIIEKLVDSFFRPIETYTKKDKRL